MGGGGEGEGGGKGGGGGGKEKQVGKERETVRKRERGITTKHELACTFHDAYYAMSVVALGFLLVHVNETEIVVVLLARAIGILYFESGTVCVCLTFLQRMYRL